MAKGLMGIILIQIANICIHQVSRHSRHERQSSAQGVTFIMYKMQASKQG
jgi:hypothetical protein